MLTLQHGLQVTAVQDLIAEQSNLRNERVSEFRAVYDAGGIARGVERPWFNLCLDDIDFGELTCSESLTLVSYTGCGMWRQLTLSSRHLK
jgi:hypothetical protein